MDPKEIINESKSPEYDDLNRPTGNTIVRVLYADGTVEYYRNWPTLPEGAYGTFIKREVDKEQRRIWEFEQKQAQAEEKEKARRGEPGKEVVGPTGIPIGVYDDTGTFRSYSDAEQRMRIRQLQAEGKIPSDVLEPKGTPKPKPSDINTWIKIYNPNTGQVDSLMDPETGQTIAVSPAPQPPRPPQRAPRFPEEVELDRARIGSERLRQEQIRRQLIPDQIRMLSEHYQLLNDLQQQLAAGRITPEEANRYADLSKQQIEATLQGTTPHQMAQDRVKAKQEQQKLGRDLINQRLSTGSTLASSLLSTTGSLLKDALIPKGQRIEFDPIALAMELTDQLGGGPQVSEFAQSLLTGTGQPPAVAASAPAQRIPTPEEINAYVASLQAA